jgi:ferredoxin--NADP+ reductase
MVRILKKKTLNASVTSMELSAPLEASKAEPGQFVVVRADESVERIPLPITDIDRAKGALTILFQVAGRATWRLNCLQEGDVIQDFIGPLGKATDCTANKVAIVGGGFGSAFAYPVAKKFRQKGAEIHVIAGFRSKDLVVLEDEFKTVSDRFFLMTDDGTYGRHGLVTEMLQLLIDQGERYDEVIAIGPLVMMKFVAGLTKHYKIKTTVSMNPVMLDSAGMCCGCRIYVGKAIKFACVDGPDFNGHEVDFNDAIARSAVYRSLGAGACHGGPDENQSIPAGGKQTWLSC